MSETATPDTRRTESLRSPLVQASAEAAAFAMMAFAAASLLTVGQRREIATELAEDWLRQRGIESNFEIETIDAGAFAGKMRVGPARNPVFEAERVEVAYDLTAPWAGGPLQLSTRAIRVVRPRLRVSFDGRRFSAGPLDPLISDFLKRPKTDEPGPAVLIEDSLTTIATRNGDVRITGDAALDDGKLLRFDGRLAPLELKGEGFALASPGGSLRLRKAGERLDTDFRLAVDELTTANTDLDRGQAAIAGTIPYPDPQAQALAGQADLRIAVAVDRAAFGEAAASGFSANTRLVGALGGSFAKAAFNGAATGQARMAALDAEGLDARGLRGDFSLPALALQREGSGLRAGGPLSFRARAASTTARDITLTSAQVSASGRFNVDRNGHRIVASGEARGDGGLPAARARRIAHAVPVLSSDPAQEQAMAAALQGFRARASRVNLDVRNGEVKLALAGPVTIDASSGGQARITPRGEFALLGGRPSAFDIAMRGGGLPDIEAGVDSWAYRGGDIDARLALRGALNAPPARGAEIEAEGVLRVRRGRTTFELTRCGRASAELVDFGDIDVTDASARLCAAGGPLVVATNGGWRVAGRFEEARGDIPVWSVAASQGSGRFDVAGRGAMDRADIDVAALRVADTQETTRFNPLRASGRAALAGGVWRASFPFGAEAGQAVGTLALTHHVGSGQGRADIDATGLRFARDGGLQPADLAPLGEVIREAEGPAAFTGEIVWGPRGVTSAGDLAVRGLNFRSPAGQVTGLNATIRFISLAPLVTPPGQALTIDSLDAIAPLTDIATSFELVADAVRLQSTTAKVAEGRVDLEPLVFPLTAKPTVEGIFNLHRVDLGAIVAGTSLGERIKVDAVLDGRVPFRLSPEGLRFTDGHLVAVQPGRISISRTVLSNVETGAAPASPMDATTPQDEFNAVEDFAYQAMENLAFTELEATVNSLDRGRLGVLFRIQGYHDPAIAEEARISIFDALQGDAFDKPIPLPKGTPVNLTLDTSLNFDELLAAWRRGWVDAAQ